MGLYLAIFSSDSDEDVELAGVELGRYEDVAAFTKTAARFVESGQKCPVLLEKVKCDGSLSPADAELLINELAVVERSLSEIPPRPFTAGWQLDVARELGLTARTMCDCFIDTDGHRVVDSLRALCQSAIELNEPIQFQ